MLVLAFSNSLNNTWHGMGHVGHVALATLFIVAIVAAAVALYVHLKK